MSKPKKIKIEVKQVEIHHVKISDIKVKGGICIPCILGC